jgi:hypothetical protein
MGFRDGLEKIIEIIQKEQINLTWKNYIHDITGKMQTDGLSRKTSRRIRQLAYYIPADRFYSTSEIKILHIKIAEEYHGLSPTTLRRDLELLVEKDLLKAEKNRYCSNYELLRSFLPEVSVPIRRHC